jgi:hypothetical protein
MECTAFIKEDEKNWKFDEKPKLKQKQENKNRRLALAKIQKEDTMINLRQQRISDTLKRLPEHERVQALAEETKQRRMELREAKKWRGKEMPVPTQDQARDTNHRR